MEKEKFLENLEIIKEMFPEAHGELNWETAFQLLIATILSAQSTDKGVNKATPALFARYPDAKSLAVADLLEVESYISSIGLYHTKAKNIIKTSKMLLDWGYEEGLPQDKKQMQELAGVGRKTANVVLGEIYGIPGIAVDTHVERVSKRLGIVKERAKTTDVEKKLMEFIPKEDWIKSHHHLIFFGRYHCTAKNPKCEICPIYESCQFAQKKREENE
ncbi:MAG: endonuclease III [Lactovum sp.]